VTTHSQESPYIQHSLASPLCSTAACLQVQLHSAQDSANLAYSITVSSSTACFFLAVDLSPQSAY
jgi:hypothetical protein